jgi:hypothetical protein
MADDAVLHCAAGCQRTVADQAEALAQGWENLPITNRWRCPHCWRELQAVNRPSTIKAESGEQERSQP